MLNPGIFNDDPMLYRFEGELFVGPGLGFFGSRLHCELWLSEEELFIDRPAKVPLSRPMARFLGQRFKRDSVALHYPARLWLMRIGVRILADNLAANHIAVFIPNPLENPREIFTRLDALGWGKGAAAPPQSPRRLFAPRVTRR